MNQPSDNNEMHEDAPGLPAAGEDTQAEMAAPPEEPPPLPGSFLREAREAKHLSVYEVAQSLKFSARQIEALEADDFAALPPGATFRRGFVRGYAKLLKLDPEPLLAMLDVQMPAAPSDVREPQNMGVAATPVAAGSRSSRPMLVGSVVLGLVALALAAGHYLSGSPSESVIPQPQPQPQAEAPAPAPNGTPMVAPDIRVEPGAETPASQPAVSAAELHQLVFVFHDRSWVEVTDATQRVILSGENAAGTRQAVSGKPPFQVVVGNAAGVELQYGDRQIDLKPHTRAEVARLTVQ